MSDRSLVEDLMMTEPITTSTEAAIEAAARPI